MSRWLRTFMLIVAIGCTGMNANAQSAEPEAPAAPAPARQRERAARMQVKKEKAAWLGVSTDRVPVALRQQLKMKHKGVGLIVERVEPKSPAEEAGLQQYDIIEKLNDQWLVNPEQFGVLIRMHKPADQITLSIIREGQPQQVTATLAEKELPVMGFGPAWNQIDFPATEALWRPQFQMHLPAAEFHPVGMDVPNANKASD